MENTYIIHHGIDIKPKGVKLFTEAYIRKEVDPLTGEADYTSGFNYKILYCSHLIFNLMKKHDDPDLKQFNKKQRLVLANQTDAVLIGMKLGELSEQAHNKVLRIVNEKEDCRVNKTFDDWYKNIILEYVESKK